MTRQEIFNTVYLGLSGQGFVRSIAPGNSISCLYRGPDGLKCAAGHLVPDEMYDPSWETRYDNTAKSISWFGETLGTENLDFINDLQGIHDLYRKPSEMKFNLECFAKANGLEVPIIEEV